MPNPMRRSSALLVAFSFVTHSTARAEVKCEIDRAAIDGVTIPYGTPVTLVGRCVETDWRELSPSDMDLEGVRINGRGNRDKIIFHLIGIPKERRPAFGQWCIARGRLSDGNALGPVIQFSVEADGIEPITAAPLKLGDFVDRAVDLEGTAAAPDGLDVVGETIRCGKWAADVIGKHVGVRGVVKKEGGGYRFETPGWRLLDLADLVGKTVTLEGTFWSLNGVWRFEYRDFKLIVTDAGDHPVDLPDRHGSRARVTGLLVNQLRPSLEQVSLKTDRDLVPTYVVRRAKIEFTEPLIQHYQRFREVYPRESKLVDGVPVLLAEGIRQRNIMGDETPARSYELRNDEVIEAILRTATPQTLDVLAKRMNDESVNVHLRLVYATMLAADNDARGRHYLTRAAGRRGDTFASTLYCLGAFAQMMPGDAQFKTEIAWVEPVLVKLMTERDPAGKYTSAMDVVLYSRIPQLMVRLDTSAARSALINFAAAGVDEPDSFFHSNTLRVIAASDMTVPHLELLRLETVIREPGERRSVLHIALRENDAAASLFFGEFGDDNWFASDARDHLTPEIVDALRGALPGLPAKAQPAVRRLVLLGQEDPVPELIKLLSDPTWTDKNMVMWELSHQKDARVIAPIFKILREGKPDFFQSSGNYADYAVEHAISAVANQGTRESIANLIELLDVDLTRFSKGYTREGYQRIVAAHLIDLTGESFGTDAAAWRKWFATR